MTAWIKRWSSPLSALAILIGLAHAMSDHPAHAQTALASTVTDTIIVLDASGSMWGQIDGTNKIVIARQTLASVLGDVPPSMNLGMITYGHRVRGDCADIEQLVPVGPARQTVQPMIEAANAINPRGMTPLTDAVRLAAQTLRHTERAATVVLVTDGLETCEADPCALGRELEAAGINFTAHVVGFGLSDEEGRQVACLADATGGLYVPANDADGLNDALRQTVAIDESDFVDEAVAIEPDPSDFAEEIPQDAAPRRVEFILRDSDGGPQLTIRNVAMQIEALGDETFEGFELYYEDRPFTAAGTFEPGSYVAFVTRNESSSNQIRARLEFQVEPGEGTQTIERSIAARLTVNTFINANEPLPPGETVRSGVAGTAGAYYWAYPIVDGVPDEANVITDSSASFDRTLPTGTYLLRGTFARTITREKLVTLEAGQTTELDFDFALTRVYFDVRDGQGFPAVRQTTFLTDQGTGTSRSIYFASGSNFSSAGDPGPFFLPQGLWRVNTGAEGGGARRAEVMVRVDGSGAEQRLQLSEGQRLSDADIAAMSGPQRGAGCLARRGTSNAASACLVEEADFSSLSALPDVQPEVQPDPPAPDGLAYDELINPATPPANEGAAPTSLLPPGIYAMLVGARHEAIDPSVEQSATLACVREPAVIYPDGVLVSKRFDADLAAMGTAPYVVAYHAICIPGPDALQCETREGDIGSTGAARMLTLNTEVSAQGHVNLVPVGPQPPSLLYACLGPDRVISPTQTLPDGRLLTDHIIERTDGGPELSLAEDGSYTGPAAPRAAALRQANPVGPPAPGGDFSSIAGLYGILDRGQSYPLTGDDLLDQCYFSGLALFPDGLVQGFQPNLNQEPPEGTMEGVEPFMHMLCRGDANGAQCDSYAAAYPDSSGGAISVELTRSAADALQLCQSGNGTNSCAIAQLCQDPRRAFAEDPPTADGSAWFERVLTRQDGGPAL